MTEESTQGQNQCLVLERDSWEYEWESDDAKEQQGEWPFSEVDSTQSLPKDKWLRESTPVPQCKDACLEVGRLNQDVEIHMRVDDLN